MGNALRDANDSNFRQLDLRKLPKFALLLGHNNEVQLCLLLKIDKKEGNRYVQVLVVNKIYLDVEINKEEREREEARLGIKRKLVLQFENAGVAKKDHKGAVEGTDNEYQYNVYWVRPNEILEVYKEPLKHKTQIDDTKKCYA